MADPEGYALAPHEVDVLRAAREKLSRIQPPGPKGGGPVEGSQAPEVYVARTPPGGVPGLEEYTGTAPDEPGSGECQIFSIQRGADGRGRLRPIVGLSKQVFNLSHRELPGSAWVVVVRTKGGVWVIPGNDPEESVVWTGTGTGTADDPANVTGGGACSDLSRLNSDDCVLAAVSHLTQTVRLNNSGGSVWTSVGEITYPLGSGSLVLTWNSTGGKFDLTLDGLTLQDCGNGCWTGSWLTGHVNNLDDAIPCNGETFTVCLECHCCPVAGYAGENWYCVRTGDYTGTSTGTGRDECESLYVTDDEACGDLEICSGPYSTKADADAVCGAVTLVQAACCVNPVPSVLYLTFTGDLVALGTVAVAWDGAFWRRTNVAVCGQPADGSAEARQIILACVGGGAWEMSLIGGANPTCQTDASAEWSGIDCADIQGPTPDLTSGSTDGGAGCTCPAVLTFSVALSQTPP